MALGAGTIIRMVFIHSSMPGIHGFTASIALIGEPQNDSQGVDAHGP